MPVPTCASAEGKVERAYLDSAVAALGRTLAVILLSKPAMNSASDHDTIAKAVAARGSQEIDDCCLFAGVMSQDAGGGRR